MEQRTFAFRKPTFWEKVKEIFGYPLPFETQPLSGGTFRYTGTEDRSQRGTVISSNGKLMQFYDVDGKQFQSVR